MTVDVATFALWLKRGLGRPHGYLQTQASARYHAALLHTCLTNPVYDRQCEGSRAAYLLDLIQQTGAEVTFRDQILAAFAAPDETVDQEQLFDFALRFAQAGHVEARTLMYARFAANVAQGDETGASQLVELDGLDGLRAVAARLGELAREDPEYWDSDYLLQLARERGATDAAIAELGAADSDVQCYLDQVAVTTRRRALRSAERMEQRSAPYATIRERLLSSSEPHLLPGLQRWGRDASDTDLAAAAADLLRQDEPARLARFLAIFAEQAFPPGWAALLPYARHPHARVARRALVALGRFQSPALHDLGVQLLREGWHVGAALDLFVRNYQPGDDRLFLDLLAAAQDDDAVHELGSGIADVLATNQATRAFELRTLLYERQPCSFCRAEIVQQLAATATMPDWMRAECRFDVDERTRRAAVGSACRSPSAATTPA